MKKGARRQWLAPEILPTQEVEIRRITVQVQARDPISKNPITRKGWWSGLWYRLWVQAPVTQKERNEKGKKVEKLKKNNKLVNQKTKLGSCFFIRQQNTQLVNSSWHNQAKKKCVYTRLETEKPININSQEIKYVNILKIL
jgi:hypothetical protein